ncbi:MAG: hypothetical protein B1H04_02670 [Planctomycetales bacterium 4484_123]|nr:MAG: hypothetical protein B1H04_02670 [Planctomycetales bacterium 4484_123]
MQGVAERARPAEPLRFEEAAGSVFSTPRFLAVADLSPAGVGVSKLQWQSAVGRRVLTPEEQAARERYFTRKAAAAMARLRRRARRSSAP